MPDFAVEREKQTFTIFGGGKENFFKIKTKSSKKNHNPP